METAPAMDHRLTRRAWGTLEPLHVVGYLAEGPRKAFADVGLPGRRGYFAQRAAPMGPVGEPLVTATFYVFSPALVARSVPLVWDLVSPEEATAVRQESVAATLHAVLGDPDVTEAVELARTACAGLSAPGRPLYAAHSGLAWPADPLMQLWHAISLLREYRGDGHIAALIHAGLDPVEALVIDGLTVGHTEFVRTTRGWTDDEWAAGHGRLRARGLLEGGPGDAELTGAGKVLKADLESDTDETASAGWAHLGAEGTGRLIELVAPLRAGLRDAAILPPWIFGRK